VSKSAFFKAALIGVLLVGIVLAFSACGGGGDVVGKWKDTVQGQTYEFKADGTLIIADETIGEIPATYKVSGGTMTIEMEGLGEPAVAPYKIDGGTMTISPEGEDPVVLERQ
jgi:hypothetical protein